MGTKALVTGGAGYIGSHVCTALLAQGWDLAVLDNLSTSTGQALSLVQRIGGRPVELIQADIRDRERVFAALDQGGFDVVLHFAALKVLTDSLTQPLSYYEQNVSGTVVLLQAMQAAGVRNLVFSSSAAVYGTPLSVPIDESAPLLGANPYARSKAMGEQIIADLVQSDARWRAVCLRYFNPVGAHESGLLGEMPHSVPSNLMPIVCDVALGKRPFLHIFGDEHPTPDGTCIRDFIHVMDLAEGHVQALNWVLQASAGACLNVNLGTGQGHSVRELVQAFEAASGRAIACQTAPVRPGEVPVVYARAELARRMLGWQARRGLDDMCRDAWRWVSQAHHLLGRLERIGQGRASGVLPVMQRS